MSDKNIPKIKEYAKQQSVEDTIGMILSNRIDYGGDQGGMVSVKQFDQVAKDLIEIFPQLANKELLNYDIYTGRVNGSDVHQKEEQYIKFIAKKKEQIELLIDLLCSEIRRTDMMNIHNERIAGMIGEANRLKN